MAGRMPRWNSHVTKQMPWGFRADYKLSPAGSSNCDIVAANSPKKVLKSFPWTRHFFWVQAGEMG
jgi:hypothetical protein